MRFTHREKQAMRLKAHCASRKDATLAATKLPKNKTAKQIASRRHLAAPTSDGLKQARANAASRGCFKPSCWADDSCLIPSRPLRILPQNQSRHHASPRLQGFNRSGEGYVREGDSIRQGSASQKNQKSKLPPRSGDDRDRTGNPCLAKAVLSQLSYVPEPVSDSRTRPGTRLAPDVCEWAYLDSNQGPPLYQSCALAN